MFNPRVPYRLQLSRELEPEEVSQAWEYLASLPEQSLLGLEQPQPPVPENLHLLSDADWFLLDNLLAREMHLKEKASLH